MPILPTRDGAEVTGPANRAVNIGPVRTVTFRLPHGSVVRHSAESGWAPRWSDISHDLDLVPYRTLIDRLAALPRSWTTPILTATAFGLGIQMVRVTRVPVGEQTFPPPLRTPAAFGSLTAYLKGTPEARQAIRVALRPDLTRPPDVPILSPPLGANPGLVGTAFDYALRFRVQGLQPELQAKRSMLVARLALLHMDRERTLLEIDQAEGTLQEVAEGRDFEEIHARAAVVLASYEVVARTGRFQDLAGVVPEVAWQDVLALVRAVPREAFRANRQLLLNPHFPAAGRFGGADADLLIDDLLIEVKATRHLRLDSSYLQQLTAYLVLDRLAGTVGSDLPIRRLGVYYARHGVLQILPVREVFRPGFLPRLVTWFDESLPED